MLSEEVLDNIEAAAKGESRGMEGIRFTHAADTLLLVAEVRRLAADNARLLRGDFTEVEFQNLCHNLSTKDRARFERGCKDYQNKLFGAKK